MWILNLHHAELRPSQPRVLQIPSGTGNWGRLPIVGDNNVGVREQEDTWSVHSGGVLDAGVWDLGQLHRDVDRVFDIRSGLKSPAE